MSEVLVSLSRRSLDTRWIERNLTLNFHLKRSSRLKPHIRSTGQHRHCQASNPARTGSDARSLAARGHSTDDSSCRCASGRLFCLSTRIAIPANRSFLVFHRSLLRARSVLNISAEQHGISARIDHRSEVNQKLRPAFHMPAALHARNLSLDVSADRNDDVVVHDKRKSSFRIDRIAFARALGRNRLLKADRYSGSSRDRHGRLCIGRDRRPRDGRRRRSRGSRRGTRSGSGIRSGCRGSLRRRDSAEQQQHDHLHADHPHRITLRDGLAFRLSRTIRTDFFRLRCQGQNAELAGRFELYPSRPLSFTSPRTVRHYVPHELRLQLLRATLTAHRERTFLHRETFIPGSQVHRGNFAIAHRGPHDPPAVAHALQDATIWTGTAVKGAWELNNLV